MAPSYKIETTPKKAEALRQLGFNPLEIQAEQSQVEQIAEPNRKNWIVIPQEFSGWKYILEVDPARLSHSPAVEKAANELKINNYKNTATDSLERDFIGNNNWQESLRLNLALGSKTPTLEESTTFGRLLFQGAKEGLKVYDVLGNQIDEKILEQYFNDIYQVKSPLREEWFDANFKTKGKKLYIHYNHALNCQGNLSPKNRKVLSKNTLMQNKTPGISLEDWLKNPTKQGLPTDRIQYGDAYYWAPAPLSNNNSVARLDANSVRFNLICDAYPSSRYSGLGVRAAKRLN